MGVPLADDLVKGMYDDDGELADDRDIRHSNLLTAPQGRQHCLACLPHSLVAYIYIELSISSNVKRRTAKPGSSYMAGLMSPSHR
ncbi:hypothetical protein BS47DRAFT_1354428, partial [Hydnum rufescens UP504]